MRKNITFFQSVRCAITGMIYAFRTEKNFRYYLGISTFFFIVNCLCHISLTEHILLIICVGTAFSAEMMNTAIEHLSDLYTVESNSEIARIKDIAAAGVLMAGNSFFIMEGIFICRRLFF